MLQAKDTATRRKSSVCDESEDNFREGVLMFNADGVLVQRYFTVYDYKISYSSRGRERSHEFTPLTRVTLLDDQARQSYHPFLVETDGQRPYVLGAESEEEAMDWVKAIQSEVLRMVLSILEGYEVKGYDDYANLTQGGEISDGRYAGYVLRKQGQQVVPLFMSLNDGKLVVKREAKIKDVLGTFRLASKTSVNLLQNYACPAFTLDKETLITSTAAIRSNWIVAFKTAMDKAQPLAKGSKFDEIDFGAPQRATIRSVPLMTADIAAGGTMRELDDTDEHNQFYKTFAGSVRIAGTVRLPENSKTPTMVDLNTFRIVDEDMEDDGQEKFLNMRLEFEDEDSNDVLPTPTIVEEGEATSGTGTPSLESSSPNVSAVDDKPRGLHASHENLAAAAASHANALSSINGNTHKRSESLDTALRPTPPLPIGLNPVPIRSSHDKSKKNIKRIRLTSKYPEGPIRVYGGVVRVEEQYKTLIVSSDTVTSDVLNIMLSKYAVPESETHDYVLVEEEADNPINARILDAFESPLLAKLNWDNRNLQFAIRKKSELKTLEDPKNFFRVKCIDGLRTSFKFNENLACSRVCDQIGQKIQLGKGFHIYFALWMQTEQFGTSLDNQLELQLEPHQQIKVLNEDWPKLARTYISPDPSFPIPPYEITFKRWAFLSIVAERRIKDAMAINLLCEQAFLNVHRGLYVFTEEDGVNLCGLRCQLILGDYSPEVHITGYLIKHFDDFKELMPSFITSAIKKDEFEARIYKQWLSHKGKSKFIVQLLFLQYVRQWPFYGATFFNAQMITTQLKGTKRRTFIDESKGKGQPVRVGVNAEGIHLIDPVKNVLISSASMDMVSIYTEYVHKQAFFFEVEKIISKGTLQRRDRDQAALTGLYSIQAPLIASFVTTALNQRDQDASALRVLRNLQRNQVDINEKHQLLRHSVQVA